MTRFGEHQALHPRFERAVGARRVALARDAVEAVERLAHGEGERRPDFEDGEAVIDQGLEQLGRLVVGGMRLEDDCRLAREHRAELARLRRLVRRDPVVIELDARLDDHRDHPRKGVADAELGEGAAVLGKRGERRLRPRHFDRVERMGGAARRRHLGADDVDRRLAAGPLGRPLGDRGEACRARRDDLVAERGRLAEAAHAGVEMDLREARLDVSRDHRLGPLHRFVGRQMLPRIGPEVIAAEDEAGKRKPGRPGDLLDEAAEVRRRHAGVAAFLVDLVAGRLDQHPRLAGC